MLNSSSLSEEDRSREEESSLTAGIGTRLYCANEQLQSGKQRIEGKKSSYGSAVDIFSAGIVLFEMVYRQPFSTASERIHVIQALRDKRELPSEMIGREDVSPNLAALILRMTSPDGTQRPTAVELLENDIFPSPFFLDGRTMQFPIKWTRRNSMHLYTTPCDSKPSPEPRAIRPGGPTCRLMRHSTISGNSYGIYFNYAGAVEVASPVLTMKPHRESYAVDSTMLLNGSGHVVHLPNSLLENWRFFMDDSPSLASVQHFQVGNVFLPQPRGSGSHPQHHFSAVYDVTAPLDSRGLVDHDVLSAALEIAQELGQAGGPIYC